MKTTTWTTAPAALVGPDGSAMRACTDLHLRTAIGTGPAPWGAQVRGTGVPAGSAARLRPEFQTVGVQAQAVPTTHNSIDGTTLGFHPSRRPLS